MSDKDYSGCMHRGEADFCKLIQAHRFEGITNDCFNPKNANCYYKQLQAKSEECEELRIAYGKEVDSKVDKIQETTTLKQKLDTAVEALEFIVGRECSFCNRENKHKHCDFNCEKAYEFKAKTALDRIKSDTTKEKNNAS